MKQISKYLFEEYFPLNKNPDINQVINEFKSYFSLKEIECSQNIFSAFVHKSFYHEAPIKINHNEKLEFLGDSVLSLAVTSKLLRTVPDSTEGELSKIRSSIVNEKSLSKLALFLKLDELILVGKGELKESGYLKESILSDCFEAMLGAYFLDHGYMKTEVLLLDIFSRYESKNNIQLFDKSSLEVFDAKSKLQELTAKKFKEQPQYISEEIEIDGIKKFRVKLSVQNFELAEMTNVSKKKAMQLLAKKVLDQNLLDKL